MKKFSFAIAFTIIAAISFVLVPQLSGANKLAVSMKDVTAPATSTVSVKDSANSYSSIYESLDLASKGLSKEAFDLAIAGYNKLSAAGKIANNKLSIVDFSQPSTKKRLYVIDLKENKLLFNTLVAHGKNSGELMATNFSNTAESNQSSLGFYITAEKYMGKHGLSMKLDGVEQTNNKARERAIVMHAADYVNENFAKARGYIGRSWGCPAVSPKDNEPIINSIGNGSCLFVYSPKADYIQTSLATR